MAERALKNDIFVWEGKDKKGQKIKGEIGGQTEALVKANLRRQGISPLRVRKKGKPLFGGGGNATPKDIAIFSSEGDARGPRPAPLPRRAHPTRKRAHGRQRRQ